MVCQNGSPKSGSSPETNAISIKTRGNFASGGKPFNLFICTSTSIIITECPHHVWIFDSLIFGDLKNHRLGDLQWELCNVIFEGVCANQGFVAKESSFWNVPTGRYVSQGLVRLYDFSWCKILPKRTNLLETYLPVGTIWNVTCYATDPWGGFLRNVVPHFTPSFSKWSASKKSKFSNFHLT